MTMLNANGPHPVSGCRRLVGLDPVCAIRDGRKPQSSARVPYHPVSRPESARRYGTPAVEGSNRPLSGGGSPPTRPLPPPKWQRGLVLIVAPRRAGQTGRSTATNRELVRGRAMLVRVAHRTAERRRASARRRARARERGGIRTRLVSSRHDPRRRSVPRPPPRPSRWPVSRRGCKPVCRSGTYPHRTPDRCLPRELGSRLDRLGGPLRAPKGSNTEALARVQAPP